MRHLTLNPGQILGWVISILAIGVLMLKTLWVPIFLSRHGLEGNFGINASIEIDWVASGSAFLVATIFLGLGRWLLGKWGWPTLVCGKIAAVIIAQTVMLIDMANMMEKTP